MTFERALALTLGEEGGVSNVPQDRGGYTYRGIRQDKFNLWRDANKEPRMDVAAICEAELRSFYRIKYWNAAHCADCPERVGCLHFDTAVQFGHPQAIRMLQQALGFNGHGVDGAWGPQTAEAIAHCDEDKTLAAYFTIRGQLYDDIAFHNPSQSIFLKGWHNRLASLETSLDHDRV